MLYYASPPDGVVLVDPEYLKDRKVYAHILAAFRYGREDLDVLGLTFRKDLFLASLQVDPSIIIDRTYLLFHGINNEPQNHKLGDELISVDAKNIAKDPMICVQYTAVT